MTRICCNTIDTAPHAEGCPYAIGNTLNRPCAKHSIRGCPACRTAYSAADDEFPLPPTPSTTRHANERGEGESALPNPSIPARARESGPYVAERDMVRERGQARRVFAYATQPEGGDRAASYARARQIADALNMLHAVRAGTAGVGAAAPLGWNEWTLDRTGVLHMGQGVTCDLSAALREVGWRYVSSARTIGGGGAPGALRDVFQEARVTLGSGSAETIIRRLEEKGWWLVDSDVVLAADLIEHHRAALRNMENQRNTRTAERDTAQAQIDRLATFFREEAQAMGREGDLEGWSPVETAIHNLRADLEADKPHPDDCGCVLCRADAFIEANRGRDPETVLACLGILGEVRAAWPSGAGQTAIDDAAERIRALAGTGLPDKDRRPFRLGQWATSKDHPERGPARVMAFWQEADGDWTVRVMWDDGQTHSADFYRFDPSEAPADRYAWTGEPGSSDPEQRPAFELRGVCLFDGDRHLACCDDDAAEMVLAGMLCAEAAASLGNPADQLRAYLAARFGAAAVDLGGLEEISRRLNAPSDGPFTAGKCELPGYPDGSADAAGAAVFSADGEPFLFVHPDTVVGGEVRHAVDRCARIAAALNAVEGMTCPLCHDLGNAHAPDCPTITERDGSLTFTDLFGFYAWTGEHGNVQLNLGSVANLIIGEVTRRQARETRK